MIAEDVILSQVKDLEQKLKVQSSEQINETLLRNELQTAGEMFMYLTMCPTIMKAWITFYKDLFQTQSPGQIILTLNRLTKGSTTHQTNKYFNTLAGVLLKKIFSMLPGKRNGNTPLNTEARPPKKLEGNFNNRTSYKLSCVYVCLMFASLPSVSERTPSKVHLKNSYIYRFHHNVPSSAYHNQ